MSSLPNQRDFFLLSTCSNPILKIFTEKTKQKTKQKKNKKKNNKKQNKTKQKINKTK